MAPRREEDAVRIDGSWDGSIGYLDGLFIPGEEHIFTIFRWQELLSIADTWD